MRLLNANGLSQVIDCIGDLFSGAKHIQNWLNMAAKLISKSIPPDRIEASMQTLTTGGRGKAKKSEPRTNKEQMTSVIWTTPLGLPIVQPYRQEKRKQIMTKLQTVYISDPNVPAAGMYLCSTLHGLYADQNPVNTQKQASAFPPNFIHSLDATHMMLTALQCQVSSRCFYCFVLSLT